MHEWLVGLGSALTDAQAWDSFRRIVTKFALAQGLQYALLALLFWGTLHVLLRRRLAHRLISGWPRGSDIRREITYSISSVLLYSAGAAAILGLLASGRVELYEPPLQHGWAWLVLSLPALLLWQDFVSYCTHRCLHTRWLFRHVHGVHHRSREPSPWASYAVHPVEAMVNGLPLLALLVVPLQETVFIVFVLHQVVHSIYGHSAVETLPRPFARHRFWGLLATTTHHHMHHEAGNGNYGLWFTWWDRIFGTEHADYLQRFDAATGPRPSGAPDAAEALA